MANLVSESFFLSVCFFIFPNKGNKFTLWGIFVAFVVAYRSNNYAF